MGSVRERLMERTSDIGDPWLRIPRKSDVVASRQSANQSFSFHTMPIPRKRKPKSENASTAIRRDSKEQLNVALDGKPYEKAKSRRIRQKEALHQSGDRDEAVPLGASKNRAPTNAKSYEVSDLEKQFEQKSFSRQASISHKLKQFSQRPETKEPLKKKQRTKSQKEASKSKAKTQQRPSTIKKAKRGKKTKASAASKKSSAVVKVESSPQVIDLLDDSATDDEDYEHDVIRSLTHFLQTEAIGHSANRKEMREYAQHLNKLGLHSREMILYYFHSDDIAEPSKQGAAKTKNDNVDKEVNKWKWMKPAHKAVLKRWVRSQR